jgi:hypothetical protein
MRRRPAYLCKSFFASAEDAGPQLHPLQRRRCAVRIARMSDGQLSFITAPIREKSHCDDPKYQAHHHPFPDARSELMHGDTNNPRVIASAEPSRSYKPSNGRCLRTTAISAIQLNTFMRPATMNSFRRFEATTRTESTGSSDSSLQNGMWSLSSPASASSVARLGVVRAGASAHDGRVAVRANASPSASHSAPDMPSYAKSRPGARHRQTFYSTARSRPAMTTGLRP